MADCPYVFYVLSIKKANGEPEMKYSMTGRNPYRLSNEQTAFTNMYFGNVTCDIAKVHTNQIFFPSSWLL